MTPPSPPSLFPLDKVEANVEDSMSSSCRDSSLCGQGFLCAESCISAAYFITQPMYLTPQLLSGSVVCFLVHQRFGVIPSIQMPCMAHGLDREDGDHRIPTKNAPSQLALGYMSCHLPQVCSHQHSEEAYYSTLHGEREPHQHRPCGLATLSCVGLS